MQVDHDNVCSANSAADPTVLITAHSVQEGKSDSALLGPKLGQMTGPKDGQSIGLCGKKLEPSLGSLNGNKKGTPNNLGTMLGPLKGSILGSTKGLMPGNKEGKTPGSTNGRKLGSVKGTTKGAKLGSPTGAKEGQLIGHSTKGTDHIGTKGGELGHVDAN